MEHTEIRRCVAGAENAVLFIHGIVGTPQHFAPLIPLVPEGWSLYNLLLDGHGGSVEAFSHTSMKKWRAQVSAAVEELAGWLPKHSSIQTELLRASGHCYYAPQDLALLQRRFADLTERISKA